MIRKRFCSFATLGLLVIGVFLCSDSYAESRVYDADGQFLGYSRYVDWTGSPYEYIHFYCPSLNADILLRPISENLADVSPAVLSFSETDCSGNALFESYEGCQIYKYMETYYLINPLNYQRFNIWSRKYYSDGDWLCGNNSGYDTVGVPFESARVVTLPFNTPVALPVKFIPVGE